MDVNLLLAELGARVVVVVIVGLNWFQAVCVALSVNGAISEQTIAVTVERLLIRRTKVAVGEVALTTPPVIDREHLRPSGRGPHRRLNELPLLLVRVNGRTRRGWSQIAMLLHQVRLHWVWRMQIRQFCGAVLVVFSWPLRNQLVPRPGRGRGPRGREVSHHGRGWRHPRLHGGQVLMRR